MIKPKKENEKKPDHILVREALVNFQRLGGAAITPLVLYQVFEKVLDAERITDLSPKAVTDVFCAICNEFYTSNYKTGIQHDLVMSETRWKKYYINREERRRAMELLIKIRVIKIGEINSFSDSSKRVQVIGIELDVLSQLYDIAESIYACNLAS